MKKLRLWRLRERLKFTQRANSSWAELNLRLMGFPLRRPAFHVGFPMNSQWTWAWTSVSVQEVFHPHLSPEMLARQDMFSSQCRGDRCRVHGPLWQRTSGTWSWHRQWHGTPSPVHPICASSVLIKEISFSVPFFFSFLRMHGQTPRIVLYCCEGKNESLGVERKGFEAWPGHSWVAEFSHILASFKVSVSASIKQVWQALDGLEGFVLSLICLVRLCDAV